MNTESKLTLAKNAISGNLYFNQYGNKYLCVENCPTLAGLIKESNKSKLPHERICEGLGFIHINGNVSAIFKESDNVYLIGKGEIEEK